jgi:hypothetical protein
MTAAYTAITILAASAYLSAAYLAISRHKIPVQVAETLGAPLSWMIPLGFIQAAGGLGLLVGFAVPLPWRSASPTMDLRDPVGPSEPAGQAASSAAIVNRSG